MSRVHRVIGEAARYLLHAMTRAATLGVVPEILPPGAEQAAERAAIVTWLRHGDCVGGDDYVARTIADEIEKGAHLDLRKERDDAQD